MRTLLILLTAAVWGVSSTALGQGRTARTVVTNSLAPSKLPSQYAAETWSTDEGLPQSTVDALAQSADGHLWVGTQEGLTRFDGVQFMTIPVGRGGLQDGDVRALAADPYGGVWVGTRDGGLAHVDPDLRVRTFGEDAGLPSATVSALVLSEDGAIWAGTRDGLCRLDPAAARPRFACSADGLPDPYVRKLLVGRGGVLWIGTRAGLARRSGGVTKSLVELGGAASQPVTALVKGRAGALWIGTLEGVGLLRNGAVSAPPRVASVAGMEATALYVDGDALWVGTYGGGLVRLQGGGADLLSEDAGTAVVRALLRDREGSLWVGTQGGGLVRLRDAKFTPFGTPEGLVSDKVYSVSVAPDGAVWTATKGGVSQVRDGRVVGRVTVADGLPNEDVVAVLAARDGSVWMAPNGAGLCRYRPARPLDCYGEADGVPYGYVSALFEDRAGRLWVGTDGGLTRWDGRRFTLVPGGPEAPVLAVAEGADGALWVGTYGAGEGLQVRRPDGTFDRVADADIVSLLKRPDGEVWAGTSGRGLLRVRPDGRGGYSVRAFGVVEGLPSNIVLAVLDGGDGALWLNTNRGVARVPLRSLGAVAAGRAERLAVRLYGRADGLRDAEGNGGAQPSAARAPDGSLWFPTNGGVVTIHPARIRTNPRPPDVAVQRLVVNGRPVRLGGGAVVVGPGAGDVEFDYAGLSFFAPDAVRHRFRLEGRDGRWTEAGPRRQAFYTDLPPGDYTFRVEAANNDGVWSEGGAAVAVTVLPFFWQTGWFAALVGLSLVGLAGAGYRARTAQLRARQRQLEATVAERTAELADEKAETERLNAELSGVNETLQERVREQLEQIVRGSRLRKFFPQKVVDRILNQEGDVAVAAERRRVTVAFTDLAGFTRLAETTPPERVTALLNEYLNEMVGLVDAHGGTLDKIMGDGMMVLFGAADDTPPDRQATQALAMAAAMQAAMDRLAAAWRAGGLGQDVGLRVGVHQADVTVGTFGSDDLVEFTAIGRGVNLAARLESAAPVGGVLASFDVFALARESFAFAEPVALRLKGIEGDVPAYPLALDPVPA